MSFGPVCDQDSVMEFGLWFHTANCVKKEPRRVKSQQEYCTGKDTMRCGPYKDRHTETDIERERERKTAEEGFPNQRWQDGAAIHHQDDLIHLLHTVAPPVSIARPRQLATRARHRPTKPKSIFAPPWRPNINA